MHAQPLYCNAHTAGAGSWALAHSARILGSTSSELPGSCMNLKGPHVAPFLGLIQKQQKTSETPHHDGPVQRGCFHGFSGLL